MNQFKSVLVKLTAGVALSVGTVTTVNAIQPVSHVEAATTKVSISAKSGAKIWTNYQDGKETGSTAAYNAQYTLVGSAVDAQGRQWYAIGQNQWVLASDSKKVTVKKTTTKVTKKKTTKKAKKTTKKKTVSQAPSNAETAAKNWIAMRESGGSYSARNGQYIGKYQLSASYLHGDYSAANQEKVANNYVKSRYGSWVNAKNFWISHGWY